MNGFIGSNKFLGQASGADAQRSSVIGAQLCQREAGIAALTRIGTTRCTCCAAS
ncbi:MAG TPA: hypothetical protein VK876_01505 [Rubrivivax sp.]|nr:hypothetical protein [Rubrivivax sp.]